MPAALTGIAVTGSVLVCPGLGGSILDWELRYQWPVSAASCSRRPGIFEAGNCAMRPGGLRKAKDRPVMTVAEKAPVGIEPTDGGFADLCLTTWLRRRMLWANNLARLSHRPQGHCGRFCGHYAPTTLRSSCTASASRLTTPTMLASTRGRIVVRVGFRQVGESACVTD